MADEKRVGVYRRVYLDTVRRLLVAYKHSDGVVRLARIQTNELVYLGPNETFTTFMSEALKFKTEAGAIAYAREHGFLIAS